MFNLKNNIYTLLSIIFGKYILCNKKIVFTAVLFIFIKTLNKSISNKEYLYAIIFIRG